MKSAEPVRAKGFTLIELLVVVTVIAILAAMLLPALARSKDQARSTLCKNHLHEMGLALQMYADDTKAYPYGSQMLFAFEPYPYVYWYAALQPYYSLNWSSPAYHCPTYSGSIGAVPGGGAWGNYGSYSYNVYGATEILSDPFGLGAGWDVDPQDPGGPVPVHSEAQIVAPSELFALMDAKRLVPYSAGIASGASNYIGSGWSGYPWTECNGLYSQSKGVSTSTFLPGDVFFMFTNKGSYLPMPHGKLFNVGCLDGHVSAIPGVRLFNLTDSAANWNVDHQPHPECWGVQTYGP